MGTWWEITWTLLLWELSLLLLPLPLEELFRHWVGMQVMSLTPKPVAAFMWIWTSCLIFMCLTSPLPSRAKFLPFFCPFLVIVVRTLSVGLYGTEHHCLLFLVGLAASTIIWQGEIHNNIGTQKPVHSVTQLWTKFDNQLSDWLSFPGGFEAGVCATAKAANKARDIR